MLRRHGRVGRAVLAALAAAAFTLALGASSACRTEPFGCTRDDECASHGDRGTCVTGACAFVDTRCPSGKRFGSYGASDVAGSCVPSSSSPDDGGGARDGGVDAEGGADAPAGVNLVANPGCDQGVAGWALYNATIDVGAPARTGANACRLCSTQTGAYSARTSVPIASAPAVGSTYEGHAWARATSGSALVDVGLTEDNAAADTSPTTTAGASDWTRLSVTHTVTQSVALRFRVSGHAATVGECILFDDAVADTTTP